MPNVKISALTADAAPTADDLVVTVNDPGGTPATRKATITNFTKAIPAVIGDLGAGGTKGLAPAPAAGDAAAGKFLKADGTYAVPSGSGAPADATYLVQTASGGLSNEQAMGALATGIVKNTTTTGVQSIADANDVSAPVFAADAGSNDTYVATLSPAPSAYVTGAHYRFKANTANTGACTIDFNGLGAKTIKKAAGGITTDLANNDILAGQWVDLVYDGTNMQMQSTLGNAGGGGGTPGGADTQVQFNDGGAFNGESTMTYNKTTDRLTVENLTVNTTSTLATVNVSGTTTFNGAVHHNTDMSLRDGSGNQELYYSATNKRLQLANNARLSWTDTDDTANAGGSTQDTGIVRHAASVIEINNGTKGQSGCVLLRGRTFANLPGSPVAGTLATVTDSNTATWGATIAGGGANNVLARFNGTNWTVVGI